MDANQSTLTRALSSARGVISPPPKTYLDTQIVVDAATGKIRPSEWETATRYLRAVSRYCVSALTITELLWGLARSEDRYFEMHKCRLRTLLQPDQEPEVFDFIHFFAAAELGLTFERPSHLEGNFVNTIKLILSAPSKAALASGFSHPDDNRKTVKIRLDRFSSEFEAIQNDYIQHLARLKDLAGVRIPPRTWTAMLLAFYGIEVKINVLDEVFSRFSAMYEFEMNVRNLILNANFDLMKNKTDLIDGQQLIYLCNAETIFITNDSDFFNRTTNSSQRNRIRKFADLLDCAGKQTPLL